LEAYTATQSSWRLRFVELYLHNPSLNITLQYRDSLFLLLHVLSHSLAWRVLIAVREGGGKTVVADLIFIYLLFCWSAS
jgi:hypothetical protein